MKLSYQVLVAIVECEDGEPSDDVEEWTMREFGELADAERFAESVYSNNADTNAFALANLHSSLAEIYHTEGRLDD